MLIRLIWDPRFPSNPSLGLTWPVDAVLRRQPTGCLRLLTEQVWLRFHGVATWPTKGRCHLVVAIAIITIAAVVVILVAAGFDRGESVVRLLAAGDAVAARSAWPWSRQNC